MTLTYVLTEERGTVSFNPTHSDTLLNLTFEEQLIGTLVKFNNRGYIEPYLAKKWNTSNENRTWSFELKSNLTCEDGTPITGDSFVKGFNTLIRHYIKYNKFIPVFNNLIGFDEFKSGTSTTIQGLSSKNNQIQFDFKLKPDAILEFLSMPYYGFHCPANFDTNGEWSDEKKVISSAGYTIYSHLDDSIVLKKRKDWFSHVEGSPDEVIVIMKSFEEASRLPNKKTIIQRRLKDKNDIIAGYTKFLSTPTDLLSIVLSHKKSKSPFASQVAREQFRSTIRDLQKSIPLNSEIAVKTKSFFQNGKEIVKESIPVNLDGKNQTLDIVLSNAIPENSKSYVTSLIYEVGRKFNFKVNFKNEDRSKPGWKERLDELIDFDIRVARVDIGSSYGTGVVSMMFCSRLGVSFPDPSENICKHIKRILKEEREVTLEDANEFEKLVVEDASVIPVLHTAHSWLISNDIQLNQFSPTSNFMRFDLISIK